MANLIIVSGPQSLGKMTIAEKLRDKIGYRLMTNHDSIELSDVVFERKSTAQKEFNLLISPLVYLVQATSFFILTNSYYNYIIKKMN